MRSTSRTRVSSRVAMLAGVVGVALTVAACSSDSVGTAPDLAARGNTLPAGALAKVLLRTELQTASEKGSLTITARSGGRIVLPKSGLTVTVPAGAITSGTMTIVVTSIPGKGVAYDFAPHGAKFARPLTLTQSMTGTTWAAMGRPTLFGVYHAGALNSTANTVTATEVLPMRMATDRKTGVTTGSYDVSHFSGYVVSSGRADEVSSTSLGM